MARNLKPRGRGVFACRICGQAIPPTYEWVVYGLNLRPVWEAGYCSHDHQEVGRRAGWTDDLVVWNHQRDAVLAAQPTSAEQAHPSDSEKQR